MRVSYFEEHLRGVLISLVWLHTVASAHQASLLSVHHPRGALTETFRIPKEKKTYIHKETIIHMRKFCEFAMMELGTCLI